MKTILIAAVAIIAASPAFAHSGGAAHASFLSGIAHPFVGADHLIAMLTVGLWAALNGGRSLWIWPAAFVGAMLFGAAIGTAGVALPLIEPGILASVVVLGLVTALAVKLPVAAGVAIIAMFGVLHGQAHVIEAPAGGALGLYVAGFALATVMLHATGLGIGRAAIALHSSSMIRAAGGFSAAAGLALVLGVG